MLFPKIGMHRDEKLRRLARHQACTVDLPGWHNPETTVWAHSNQPHHGKASRLKSHDCFGFIACDRCHHAIDQGRVLSNGERRRLTDDAMRTTRTLLIGTGAILGAGVEDVYDDDRWLEGWKTGRIRVA